MTKSRLYPISLVALLASIALPQTVTIQSVGAQPVHGKNRPVYISSITTASPVVAPLTKLQVNATSPSYSKHFDQGLVFKKSGDTNHALIEFLQAIKENPRCLRAFYEQALIFRQKGYPKLAESALSQALAVDPNYREARILLAAVRLETGNTGGAARELTRSLGLSELPQAKSPPLPVSQSSSLPISSSVGSQQTQPAQLKATPINTRNQAGQETIELKPRPVNGLIFQPEPGTESKPKNAATKPPAVENKQPLLDNDDWAKRLKYLNEHGTGSLKSGEAFMFSEDTGEAVIFLADGQRIRRRIALPQSQHELVKNRRPDMLLPADLMYKLSTLGKLVSDPAAIVDMVNKETATDKSEGSEEASAKEKPRHGSVNAGDIMDGGEDSKDNSFLNKAYLDDDTRNNRKDGDTRPLGTSPILDSAAAEGVIKGPQLDSTEPSALKEFNKDLATPSSPAIGDTIVEKTQKFVGWLKKALHIP